MWVRITFSVWVGGWGCVCVTCVYVYLNNNAIYIWILSIILEGEGRKCLESWHVSMKRGEEWVPGRRRYLPGSWQLPVPWKRRKPPRPPRHTYCSGTPALAPFARRAGSVFSQPATQLLKGRQPRQGGAWRPLLRFPCANCAARQLL